VPPPPPTTANVDMEQQQQQQQLNRSILHGIARLSDPNRSEDDKHLLYIIGDGDGDGIDRHSWQHVVDFLDNVDGSHEVIITDLALDYCRLVSNPSDGGWEVLRTFFSRSDTKLTKVRLEGCDVGTAEETLQLLAAFQSNRTVTDLTIR
jgi:hypothetical protein